MGKFRIVVAGSMLLAWGCSAFEETTNTNEADPSDNHASDTRTGETPATDARSTLEDSSTGGTGSGALSPTEQNSGASTSLASSVQAETLAPPDAAAQSMPQSPEVNSSASDGGGSSSNSGDHSAEPPDTSSASTPTCRETAGLCDPIGECAKTECDFDNTGKSCTYTPARTYPFMCVRAGDFEPYRPCDTDDVCAPGSVCISKVAILADGSFYRRPGPVCRQTCRQDDDCGDGEWCAQATDDNNEVVPDLRVCHRHCETEEDCYVGEGDDEVRCSNSVEGAPPSTYECSRYRPPADAEANRELAEPSSSDVSLDEGLTALSFRSWLVSGETCVFIDDCSEDQDCVDGTCRRRCETNDNCDGAECVTVNGRGVCGATCEKPPGAACALVPSNCGCPTGETCQLGQDLEPSCAPPGESGLMSWCYTSDDCDSTLSCVGGLCRPLCDQDAHPCPAHAGECLLSVSRASGDIFACGGSCDPVTSNDETFTGCGLGGLCIAGFDASHHSRALCASERPGDLPNQRGESCNDDFDCAGGLGCDADATCQQWCRTESDCGAGQTCKPDASHLGPTASRFGRDPADLVGLCQD